MVIFPEKKKMKTAGRMPAASATKGEKGDNRWTSPGLVFVGNIDKPPAQRQFLSHQVH
ncbi:hypothetical protein [Pseudomonas huaxiensis]|uniref:hypothetical protein n=1 Tax=Pseudomonas huaxiensis TaxID=2213017 RepID=UPI0013008E2B|nr:hypothetical protein [Pseudomonas huaxiensis]